MDAFINTLPRSSMTYDTKMLTVKEEILDVFKGKIRVLTEDVWK